jgi:hypothetical protein
MKLALALAAALRELGIDKLARSEIKIGDVVGYHDAIVRRLTADKITLDHVRASTGDVIVEDLNASKN